MNKIKVLDVIDEIIINIELANVSRSQMFRDIKRMGFKIKPVSGDITTFEKIQFYFLKPLWKMGMVDEIVQKYLYELEDEEREILFDFLREFEHKTQADFNQDLLKKKRLDKTTKFPLKLEIFRDRFNSSKVAN